MKLDAATKMDAGSGSGSGSDEATVVSVSCGSATIAATGDEPERELERRLLRRALQGSNANCVTGDGCSVISVGDIVEFMPLGDHPVGPDSRGTTDSGLVAPGGATTCLKFTAAGNFRYNVHGARLRGRSRRPIARGSWYTTAVEDIAVDERGPVARITLNRPERKNPIGPRTIAELIDALAQLKADGEVRVVVLTGAGDTFCAGADLKAVAAPSGKPKTLVELLAAMHELGKPIIAMVNGNALAGGLGLMVACDLVVCADTAKLGTTEIAVGLWPMMITAELTRSIGRKATLDMMLTGRKLTAAEALACGLVTRVVPASQLEAETAALTAELAARSPVAIALGLHAFYRAQDMEYEPQLRYLHGELGRVLATEDAAEGIAAFLGRRAPVWKGR